MDLHRLSGVGEGDQEAVDYGLGSWRSRPQESPDAVKRGQLDEKADILDGSSIGILLSCR